MQSLGATFDRNYLRVRGEYPVVTIRDPILAELPPRARRIQHHIPDDELINGTTSACAENTEIMCKLLVAHRNYLRVRGEYALIDLSYERIEELPPRARRIRWWR